MLAFQSDLLLNIRLFCSLDRGRELLRHERCITAGKMPLSLVPEWAKPLRPLEGIARKVRAPADPISIFERIHVN